MYHLPPLTPAQVRAPGHSPCHCLSGLFCRAVGAQRLLLPARYRGHIALLLPCPLPRSRKPPGTASRSPAAWVETRALSPAAAGRATVAAQVLLARPLPVGPLRYQEPPRQHSCGRFSLLRVIGAASRTPSLLFCRLSSFKGSSFELLLPLPRYLCTGLARYRGTIALPALPPLPHALPLSKALPLRCRPPCRGSLVALRCYCHTLLLAGRALV